MKIAIYHNLVSGGNKRSLYETVRGMKLYGHTVDVFDLNVSNAHFAPLASIADKVMTHHIFDLRLRGVLKALNPIVQLLQILPLWNANREIARLINAGGYDLAWIGNCYITQHPIILRYVKIPYILYTAEHNRGHDNIMWQCPHERSRYKMILACLYRLYVRTLFTPKMILDRQNIRMAANILVDSDFTRENILRCYSQNAKTLYLGVDTDKFYPRNNPRDNFVLSVGALDPVKGHVFIIESLKHIQRDKRPRLVIVADRAESIFEEERIAKAARSSAVDVAIFMNIEDEKLIELYNKAMFTVCANVLEPFGLVPLESMACGTPVIAIREGGFRESIVHLKTGLLVDRDERALSQAIEYLLDHEELRTTLGKDAAECIRKRFDLQTFWTNVEMQLQSVAATNRIHFAI